MKINNLDDLQEFLINKHNVNLKFIHEVEQDLKGINKGSRTSILALIIRRAIQGPLFVPDGVARSLHGDLSGFAKIKSKSTTIRCIYKPVKTTIPQMDVIAIGPRDKSKAYKLAAERLEAFYSNKSRDDNE
ncbi:type II toxin-antitoxin system RelE family toxin [Sporosarcina sp. FA9]|uniref:type II toxin-antitoxin system RelE family toxin n=1 Tax=Sporosarcina sp. FA9 TaxID=3413030 RepID=UPI003F656CFE